VAVSPKLSKHAIECRDRVITLYIDANGAVRGTDVAAKIVITVKSRFEELQEFVKQHAADLNGKNFDVVKKFEIVY
jgi:hypothetical protein